MKSLNIIILLFGFTLTTQAQYAGGDGSGYDRGESQANIILDKTTQPTVSEVLTFPNPFERKVIIQNQGSQQICFSIFDLKGRELHTGILRSNAALEIDTESWSKGVYILSTEELHSNKRLIKL